MSCVFFVVLVAVFVEGLLLVWGLRSSPRIFIDCHSCSIWIGSVKGAARRRQGIRASGHRIKVSGQLKFG